MTSFLEALTRAGAEAGFTFSEKQQQQFARYAEMLLETNKSLNLTAITDPEEVAVKHMIDSLLVCQKTDLTNLKVTDVGTGAGFPGIPLKIWNPSVSLTLIDSLAKRLNFLQQVIDALELTDVTCVHARAEDAGRNPELREQFDVAIARAVAALPVLSEYCLPLVKPGGQFIAMKGSKYSEEAADATHALSELGGGNIRTELVRLPGLEDTRAILFVEKKKVTPKKYPRKAGMVRKAPL